MDPARTPTARQREVLEALVTGTGTTLDIAARLGCAERTVDAHLTSLRNKLDRHTRVQLAVWWLIVGRYLPEEKTDEAA